MLSPLLKQSTDVLAVRGAGCRIYDDAGREYLDFTAGIGVTSTGHCHPRVVAAIREQAGDLIHGQYTTVRHPGLDALSARLAAVAPGDIDAFFFASAGTEAVESAIRLARHATGRPNVVAFQGGFHGRTMGAVSLTTSRSTYRAGLQPLVGGVHVAPFPYPYRYGWDEETATRFCLRELDVLLETRSAPDETAAMIIEPVLGEGGYVPANAAFLRGIRERCDRHGILLIFDEIQTGVGRTGRFWALEHFGVQPDVIVLAKGIASGMPLSAMGASEALMSRGRPGSQGGTYGGNAVACAAALATLDVVRDERLVERSSTLGARLREGLRAVTASHAAVGEVRGLGLMVAVELSGADRAPDGEAAARVVKSAERGGLLLLRCGTHAHVVRFIPPLVVTEEEVDAAVARFGAALDAV